MGRDSLTIRHLGPRLVLAVGVLFGLATFAIFALDRSDMVAINYRVYRVAAEAAIAGEPLYEAHPAGRPAYTFLYPPATVLAWLPFVALPEPFGFALHSAISVAAGVAIGLLAARVVEREGVDLAALDRALLVAFAVGSVHSAPTLVYGNVNLPLALALLAGFLALERGRPTAAGVAFAGPALLKVFPALVGLWPLRQRAWRTVAAATATGLGGLAVGALAFGPGTTAAWANAALGRGEGGFAALLDGGLPPDAAYVTLLQPLALLGLPAEGLVALAVLVLAPVVLYCYAETTTLLDRLVAFHATLAAALLVVPSYYVYLAFLYPTLLPLLYLLETPAARYSFLAGAMIANAAVTLGDLQAFVPPSLAWTLAGLEPALTVATPPLVGVVLTLVGCVAYRREALAKRQESRRPSPTGDT